MSDYETLNLVIGIIGLVLTVILITKSNKIKTTA